MTEWMVVLVVGFGLMSYSWWVHREWRQTMKMLGAADKRLEQIAEALRRQDVAVDARVIATLGVLRALVDQDVLRFVEVADTVWAPSCPGYGELEREVMRLLELMPQANLDDLMDYAAEHHADISS